MSINSFGSQSTLTVAGRDYTIFRLDAVPGHERLPFSLKVLLENLLRTEDGKNITADQIRALGNWDATAEPDTEIQFTPARVVMQDFTGVPCIVDLATMREAVAELGGDPEKINPLAPAELVIDHDRLFDILEAELTTSGFEIHSAEALAAYLAAYRKEVEANLRVRIAGEIRKLDVHPAFSEMTRECIARVAQEVSDGSIG